jgi:hypothetical protein
MRRLWSHRERTDSSLRFTREDLRQLADAPREPSVSCFLPTHRNPPDKREDRTRFKNLLNEAEERLVGYGLRSAQARLRLDPARQLLEDEAFWENVWDGLAVFISPSVFRRFTVSTALREYLDVGDRFYLQPLLPVLQADGRYFLLGLSQQRVALLEGTRESLVEIPVPALPQDLASALHFESFPPEGDVQVRSQSPRGGAGRQSMWGGHAEEKEDVTRFLLEFFHSVDHAVAPLLRGERAPLVLAAVEYLHPLYSQVNSYPHLLPEGVLGNPEGFRIEELHRRATAVVAAALEREIEEAVAEYSENAGGDRSSQNVAKIIVGAFFGRVSRLFVQRDAQLWGRFDQRTLQVHVHSRKEKGDVDLLDWTAMKVLATDGVVHALPPELVPGGGPMAALFRF